MKYRHFNLLIIFIIALSCTDTGGESGGSPGVDQLGRYTLVNAFPNISFDRPLDIQNAGDGTDRLFVAEQAGVIHVIDNNPDIGGTKANVFLDIRDRVFFDGDQRGILGFTFHRDYSINGFFYVFYIAEKPQRTVISRFTVSHTDPDQADPESELILLEINHGIQLEPGTCICGGQIAMGPDGYLYISLGITNSPTNGQDTTNLFGSILRIDVDNPQNNLNYSIPPDNPFFSNNEGKREEIFAFGLRNPFRFSFDTETGLIWAGDVGEHGAEEVDIIKKGGNYGWDIMEGTMCHPQFACDMTGLQLPVWAYPRTEGVTIIGGFVYRGSELPELFGSYVYADFGSGRVWALSVDENNQPINNTELLQFNPFTIVSFGVDEDNELLICSFDGRIYRLARSIS